MSAFKRYAASWMVRRLCIEIRYAIFADGGAFSLSSTMKLGLLAGQLQIDHSSASSSVPATTTSRVGRRNKRWNRKKMADREVIIVMLRIEVDSPPTHSTQLNIATGNSNKQRQRRGGGLRLWRVVVRRQWWPFLPAISDHFWNARRPDRFSQNEQNSSVRRQAICPHTPERLALDGQTDLFKMKRICLSVVNPSAVRWLGTTLDGRPDRFSQEEQNSSVRHQPVELSQNPGTALDGQTHSVKKNRIRLFVVKQSAVR